MPVSGNSDSLIVVKKSQYPLKRKTGGLQSNSGRFTEENISCPCLSFSFLLSFPSSFCPFYLLYIPIFSLLMSLTTLQHTTPTFMPSAEFEPAISASDRPQTPAFDRFGHRAVQPAASRYAAWVH